MPNWVYNVVEISGKKENIANMMKDINAKDDGTFKFDSILPMPKELNDTVGDISFMLRYMYDHNCDFSIITNDNDILWLINMENMEFNMRSDKIPKEELNVGGFTTPESKIKRMIELMCKYDEYPHHYNEKDGKKQYECYIKYNSFSWYDWRCKNYGCKWDCSNSYVGDPYEYNGVFTVTLKFYTPWDMPEPFLSFLAYKYNVTVRQKYADEDIGVNCGTACYIPWARIVHHTDYDVTDESIKFAKELWGN